MHFQIYLRYGFAFGLPMSFAAANAVGDVALIGWTLCCLPWGLLYLANYLQTDQRS